MMRIGWAVLWGILIAVRSVCGEGPAMRVWLIDGSYVDGDLSCDGISGDLFCDSPMFVDPLRLEVDVVQSITKKNTLFGRRYTLRRPPEAAHDWGDPARGLFPQAASRDWRRVERAADAPEMHLLSDSAQLAGWLVDSVSKPERRLVWQTALARNAATIRVDSQGKIAIGSPRRAGSPTNRKGALPIVFRSGERGAASIARIDDRGVLARLGDQTPRWIDPADLDSVTLTKVTKPLDVDPRDRQRLLIVPRDQQEAPPTHVVISVTGDLLRCRVVELQAETLVVEVRFKRIELPRDRVAKIVWLHSQGGSPPGADEWSLHAVLVDQRQVTLRPFAIEAQRLTGQSRALGRFSVPLSAVRSLHFGRDPVTQVSDRGERDLNVKPAPDPIAYRQDETRQPPRFGVDSPLLGKAAPPLGLQTIEGEAFSLASRRGRVVVLDFWASWSAPSLQSLSEFSQAIDELGGDDIVWVAINLEQSVAMASRALERVNLDATVLLDADGDAAYVYQAKSLPHTVVIDRRGSVLGVIESGTPERLGLLRRVLQQAVAEAP